MKETKRERELKQQIAKLQGELTTHRKNKSIKCPCCGKRTQIKNATILTCYHYISPHGCMGGDYWRFSHEYTYYCAKCDSFTRAYIGSFDQIDYGDNYKESNMTPEALELERVQMYYLIDKNSHLFGEQLDDYDYKGTIADIRKANKKREEAMSGGSYY